MIASPHKCTGLSAALPFFFPFGPLPIYTKLLTIFLTFVPCFIILSINSEGLFYAFYCGTLIVWLDMEVKVRIADSTCVDNGGPETNVNGTPLHYRPCWDDLRIALFFLFFVQVAFFGTGK